MEFLYQLTKKDMKKYWNRKHWMTNFIYLGIFTVLFLFLNYPLLRDNFGVLSVLYLIYAALILLILWLFNLVFTAILIKRQENAGLHEPFTYVVDEKGIHMKKKDGDLTILFSDLKETKFSKDWIYLSSKKEKLSFLFTELAFKNKQNFAQLKNLVQEKINPIEEKVLV